LSETVSGARPEAAFVIIGTCHEYQRHQDADSGREKIRGDFENLIRAQVVERSVGLIVEEAAKNEEVQAQLNNDASKSPAFNCLFPAVENESRETIAKLVADELLKGNHVDIRPPDAGRMTIAQRDEAMAIQTIKSLGSATSVIVICGEKHRAGLTRHLVDYGMRLAGSRRFPERCEEET
jgi:pheromone shutdown protein TraB